MNDTQASAQAMQRLVAECKALATIVPGRRYLDASFDNFAPKTKKQAAALAMARAFSQMLYEIEGSGLWLMGPPGTGKTHLAVAVVRQQVRDDLEYEGEARAHRFASHAELLREFRSCGSKGKGGTEDDFFTRYARCALLVLDDLQAPGTAGEAAALDWLIERRYRERLSTVVTTNLNLGELRLALGDRAFDRLREGTRLAVMDGPSHRARMGWEGQQMAAGDDD